jgi:hypothetical protein
VACACVCACTWFHTVDAMFVQPGKAMYTTIRELVENSLDVLRIELLSQGGCCDGFVTRFWKLRRLPKPSDDYLTLK